MQDNILNVNMSVGSIEKQRKEIEEKKDVRENHKKVEFDEKNYLNLRLNKSKNEKTKKVRIRILNITPTATTPFLVLNMHSLKVDKQISASGYKSYVCLKDEHLKSKGECPLCKKSEELFKQANSCTDQNEKKSLLKKAFSYKTKETYILRVIDRDHEDEGVKFWRFNAHSDGTGCYDMLMSIYDERMKEHIDAGLGEYNIFDLNNGKDIVITVTAVDNTDRTTISIVDAGLETPLSRDVNKALEWINDTKVWSDIYAIKNEDYLSIIADEKIPVRDKTTGKYVASSSVKENEKNIEKEAKKILEDSVNINSTATNGVVMNGSLNSNLASNTNNVEDEDLPF